MGVEIQETNDKNTLLCVTIESWEQLVVDFRGLTQANF